MAAVALVLFFAAAGLPPFSGVWPKVMVVKAALDVGAWWLAFAILLTGLLTTITLGRVFALAFWRNEVDNQAIPEPLGAVDHTWRYGYLPVLMLSAAVIAIGIWPQPLMALANGAATGILEPGAYIGSVFPEGAVK